MTYQKTLHIFASFLYSIGQITQGLFFHPYQTMQLVVREKVFFWLTLLPSAVWVVARLIWGLVIVPLVRLVFSCSQTGLAICQLIPFFARWLLYFCVLWQLILLYLLVRFSYAFFKKKS
ncbi:MAG TPA: hypothetical protein VGA89_00290 [Patescibacteria group bacterium]|jgi:hypothetical protein